MQTLHNDKLSVIINEHGAELQNIIYENTEYLWQGDSAFWGRRSPVLFPIVGSVWNGIYRIDGKEYRLGQHGFARDMDFCLASISETEAVYRLESNEATLEKYPYRFILEITYRIHDNKIDVIWEVTNPSEDRIYFQIGAHPAFLYPDFDSSIKERGFLSFEEQRNIECIRIREKGCVDTGTKHQLKIPSDGLLPISTDIFDRIDTIMAEGSQISKVTLHKPDGTPYLSLTFSAPVVGIWSPPHKNAPFICIEPWYGRCDKAGYEGDYREKDWINTLEPGKKFKTMYTIEII